jgi:hypothetical protein
MLPLHKHTLPNIIHTQKFGFIHGDFILDSVIKVWGGVEWAQASRLDALLIKIGFEKAYGNIEWPFIMATL